MAQEQDGHDDLKVFEAALAALRPRGDRFDRDRLMFLAGQASAETRARSAGIANGAFRRWGWPTAFGGMTAVAAGLFVALLVRPPQTGWRALTGPGDSTGRIPSGHAPQVAAAPNAALAGRDQHAVRGSHPVRRPGFSRNAGQESPHDGTPNAGKPPEGPAAGGGWLALVGALWGRNPPTPVSPAGGTNYLELRTLAFSRGLDAWPTPAAMASAGDGASHASRAWSQRELFDELVGKL
jgi:hypothetical protein